MDNTITTGTSIGVVKHKQTNDCEFDSLNTNTTMLYVPLVYVVSSISLLLAIRRITEQWRITIAVASKNQRC